MESKEQKQWREPTKGEMEEFIRKVERTTQVLMNTVEKYAEEPEKGMKANDVFSVLDFLLELNQQASQILGDKIPIGNSQVPDKKPVPSIITMDEINVLDKFVTDVKYSLQLLCGRFGKMLDSYDEKPDQALADVEVDHNGHKVRAIGRLIGGFFIGKDDLSAIDHQLFGLKKRAGELFETF